MPEVSVRLLQEVRLEAAFGQVPGSEISMPELPASLSLQETAASKSVAVSYYNGFNKPRFLIYMQLSTFYSLGDRLSKKGLD